jgi:hypothetical protein
MADQSAVFRIKYLRKHTSARSGSDVTTTRLSCGVFITDLLVSTGHT